MKPYLVLAALAAVVSIPASATAQEIPSATGPTDQAEMSSPGLFAGGVVLLSLGSIAVPTGLLFVGESESAIDTDPPQSETNDALLGSGIALAVGGALMAAGGITMMVIGGRDADTTVAINAQPGGVSVSGTF